jgi:hypothetical protein
LRGAAVTDVLTSTVNALAGTTLRPSGGVYWLRESQLATFAGIARACELASLDGKTAVYRVNHALDADALRAVHDAIVAEVERDANEIHRIATAEKTPGMGALLSVRGAASQLRDKLAEYERILGTQLPALADHIAAADTAAARAQLTLAARQSAQDERNAQDGGRAYA